MRVPRAARNSGIPVWIIIFAFALAACAGPSPPTVGPVAEPDHAPGPRSVAVWDMENMSPDRPVAFDWGELLSAGVIQTFQESKDYSVVEREKLIRVLEELQLGSSALADDDTRLRLGKLVGAQTMVFGGYLVVGDMMRLDMRLVNVETGAVEKAAHRTLSATDPAAGLNAAKEAARELIAEKAY